MSKHISTKPVAVFDISSGSIAGAHALVPHHVSPKETKISILANARQQTPFQEDVSLERYIDQTVLQLQKTIATIKKADTHHPKHIQVLLASPWFTSQTRAVVYTKPNPFMCTQKLIDSLIEREVAYVIEHEIKEKGSFGAHGTIIEKQVSLIKLNGYPTEKPLGKKVYSLELFLVITVSPDAVLERFSREFKKEYGGAHIQYTTTPYASHKILIDFLEAGDELMILDIGEEVTDIACIKNNLFVYQHSFPIGTYELYRNLITDKVITPHEAIATVETFYKGTLSTTMTASVQKSLDDFAQKWQRGFQESLMGNAQSSRLPSSTYILSDYRFAQFFSSVLQKDTLLAHAVGATLIHSIAITPNLFSSYVTSIDPSRIDETIAIGLLFASRQL